MIIRKVGGKFVNKEQVLQQLKHLRDGVYELKKLDGGRTNDQNRYLWGAVYPAIYEGLNGAYDIERIHGIMAYKFLIATDAKSPYIRSTSRLTTAEFTKYVEDIKDFVSQFGVYIPSSEEYFNKLDELKQILDLDTNE